MSDHDINEPTQTSSVTKKLTHCNTSTTNYDFLYNQPEYVDKTMLIKKLFEVSHAVINAPPRFGKSLNMDMVKKFVEIELDEDNKPIELDVNYNKFCLKNIQPKSKNFKLFQGKKIFQDKQFMFQHFGKYPTIYIYLGMYLDNFEEVLTKLRSTISNAFREHCYLYKSSLWDRPGFDKRTFEKYFSENERKSLSEDDLKSGLKILSKFLNGYYGRKVFVFIESFDELIYRIIHTDRTKWEDLQKIIKLLQTIIGNLLQDNEFVERSLSIGYHSLGGLLLENAKNVVLYPFMEQHKFSEFYGFEEAEVINLLKKAQKLEKLDEIKKYCNGYNKTLEDGRHIQMYRPMSVIYYINNNRIEYDWNAYCSTGINNGIGHFKIRPKIEKLISGESVTIKYVKKYSIEDIEILCKILRESEINDHGVDLFIQFLYDQGFFCPTDSGDDYLTLVMANRAAYTKIKAILYHIDLMDNRNSKAMNQFIDSLEHLAQSCEEERVRDLADKIKIWFGKENPKNESEFNAILFSQMLQRIRVAGIGWYTYIGTRCDILLVMKNHRVAFIFENNFIKKDSNDAYMRIIDKKCYTLLEEGLLRKNFSNETLTIDNRIYLGIHRDMRGKISITYSLNNMNPNLVCSKRRKI